jgi:hypothetical protein
MASSKTRAPEEEALLDADVEGIPRERPHALMIFGTITRPIMTRSKI